MMLGSQSEVGSSVSSQSGNISCECKEARVIEMKKLFPSGMQEIFLEKEVFVNGAKNICKTKIVSVQPGLKYNDKLKN